MSASGVCGRALYRVSHCLSSGEPTVSPLRVALRPVCTGVRTLASSTQTTDVTGCHDNSVDVTTELSQSQSTSGRVSGVVKSMEKFKAELVAENQPKKTSKPFLTLLRESQFCRLGAVKDAVVEARIFHTVGDDLYIDFGGKLHCVCRRPARRGEHYMTGAVVRIKLRDLELSSLFLGAKQDLSLLEADAVIVGLISTPYKSK